MFSVWDGWTLGGGIREMDGGDRDGGSSILKLSSSRNPTSWNDTENTYVNYYYY